MRVLRAASLGIGYFIGTCLLLPLLPATCEIVAHPRMGDYASGAYLILIPAVLGLLAVLGAHAVQQNRLRQGAALLVLSGAVLLLWLLPIVWELCAPYAFQWEGPRPTLSPGEEQYQRLTNWRFLWTEYWAVILILALPGTLLVALGGLLGAAGQLRLWLHARPPGQ